MKGLVGNDEIETIGNVLNDTNRPLKERFRALFTLRNLGDHTSVDWISKCFDDPSVLLTHECAFCLGQMQDEYAIPILTRILQDESREPMVRHEAGEALGAIGSLGSLEILKKYCSDPVAEVAETCQLAVKKIEWQHGSSSNKEMSRNPYCSIDPAPPYASESIPDLKSLLLDESAHIFKRYQAMFALRNLGTRDGVLALCEGFKCNSALLRHEIAYVLGQIQNDVCVPYLCEVLKNLNENEMVRHECAEALGAIATEECKKVLQDHLVDEQRVVRESCEVALDMCNYENSDEFQYADALLKSTKY